MFPFIKHYHRAILEVFLQGSGERLKPSLCWGQGKYSCMRGEWNKCQTSSVLGQTHLGAKWGWVAPLHQTSQDPGPQVWAGRGGEEMAQPTQPAPTDAWALQTQLLLFLLWKHLPKHKGSLACGHFVHWCIDDLRCRPYFPLCIFFFYSSLSLSISGSFPGLVQQVSSGQVLWSTWPDGHEAQTQLKGSIARPLGDGCFSRGRAHCHLRIRALCSDCSTKTRTMHVYFCNLVGIPFWEPTVEAPSVYSFWALKIFIPGSQETMH